MYFDEVIFDELIIPHIFMFGCFLPCPLKQVPLYIICQQVLFCFISSFCFVSFQVFYLIYFYSKFLLSFTFISNLSFYLVFFHFKLQTKRLELHYYSENGSSFSNFMMIILLVKKMKENKCIYVEAT